MKKRLIILFAATVILSIVLSITVMADGELMTLKLKNEYAYIYGYNDTYMGATENVTRAEASAMLFRLLKQNNATDNYSKPDISTYDDVLENTWYFSAVEFMAYKGVYEPKDTNYKFSPYAYITRAEAAKMFTIALELKHSGRILKYDDINLDHKYYDYINSMVGYDFMQGDADSNNIRPDSYLTRAEFVVIYNRIIGRNQSYSVTKTIDKKVYVCPFKDINESDWFYNDIIRATNSYTSRKIDLSKKLDRNSLDEYEIK